MFFTFLLFITSVVVYFLNDKIYAQDLLEQAFQPSVRNETIINLWAGKNAVGNEVLRQWVGVSVNILPWCIVNWNKMSQSDITTQMTNLQYQGSDTSFCTSILWGTWDNPIISTTTEAPLIVRITKFLLRMTMVLAVTMIIYNGIMYIIESAKWSDVKDAKQNIIFIVVWILIALMSLWIINLISSVTVSSLGWTPQ